MPPEPQRSTLFSLPSLAACAIILLLAMIAIPNFVKARTTRSRNTCAVYCMWLEAAKQHWARQNKKSPADTPTLADLLPSLQTIKPMWDGRPTRASLPLDPTGQPHLNLCPAGGQITLNPINQRVACSVTEWDELHYLQNYPPPKTNP